MEKDRATKLVRADDKKKENLPLYYYMPFTTELHEVATVLGDVNICKFAMMTVLRIGRAAWLTCIENVESSSTP